MDTKRGGWTDGWKDGQCDYYMPPKVLLGAYSYPMMVCETLSYQNASIYTPYLEFLPQLI